MTPAATSTYYDTLLHLYRVTETSFFSPLHKSTKYLYRRPVLWALQKSIAKHFSHNVPKLFARNSTAKKGHFNTFMSDLDLSAVFPETPTSSENLRMLSFHQSWHKQLPFIGEIQIHTQEEYHRLAALERSRGDLISFLWSLRKIRWMEIALENYSTPYHKRKALRAIQSCLIRLGCHRKAEPWGNISFLDSSSAKNLKKIFIRHGLSVPRHIKDNREIRVFSPHMDFWISNKRSYTDNLLVLPGKTILIFLALLPPDQVYPEPIEEIKKLPKIKKVKKQLLQYESLMVKSTLRTRPHLEKENLSWLEKIDAEMNSPLDAG